MILNAISRLFQREESAEPGSQVWARRIVASIPERDLPSSAVTFAESALRTRDAKKRAMHFAKFRAAMDRLRMIVEDATP